MPPRPSSPLAFLLFALAVLSTAAAEEEKRTWYAVELVVFAQKAGSPAEEVWPLDPGMPAVGEALDVLEAAQSEMPPELPPPTGLPPRPFTPLSPQQYQLQGTWDALARSPRYWPLLHIGWIQPGYERNDAPAVRIHAGAPESEGTTSQSDDGFPLLGLTGDGTNEAEISVPLYRPLDGIARLVLSRYLHLELDLLYLPHDPQARPSPAVSPEIIPSAGGMAGEHGTAGLDEALEGFSSEPTEFKGYRLKETRRMRSREVHYVDHPMFGVIAIVTPYELPAAIQP